LKILIAPNAFKGTLSAGQAAAAIARGLRQALPQAQLIQCPIADGGDGFAEVLAHHFAARWILRRVRNPLGKPVNAAFALSRDGTTAIIEMARASGLALLRRRDPMRASTFGAGELIRAALDRGARRIVVGIGGSASTDGGAGLARALGVRFLDNRGRDLPDGGGSLIKLSNIDMSACDWRLRHTRIDVACDVDNRLFGPRGAAHVFAPQKGARPAQVRQLDAGLRNLARIIRRDLGLHAKDFAQTPGAGAAGGTGAGLIAFCGARLARGFDLVAQARNLEQTATECDIIVTGEGRLDDTTRHSKAPFGILQIARRIGLPAIAICGAASAGARRLGFDAIFQCGAKAIKHPRRSLIQAARRAGQYLSEQNS
jgi:glycerate kinase